MYGWPVLVHYCDRCSYNTPIEYSGTVWTQEHTCTHCGNSSPGADVAGESKGAMNASQHDELSQLFANLSTSQQQQQQQQQAPTAEHGPQVSEKNDEAPMHFISSHYTQSAHVRVDSQSEPSRSPPPPYHEALMPEAMAETLRQNSIDPSALLPNQIDLFLGTDYERRLRLLELWRISPPSYPLEQHMHAHWSTTSVQQEEAEARERYEQQMQGRIIGQEEHTVDPVTALRDDNQAGWPPAARMRAASIAAGQKVEVEPYIVNGYEIAASRRAVDPVYDSGLWQAPSYAHAIQQESQQQHSMEDQYGMYEQIRNHADWERMNQQNFSGFEGHVGMDDEMMM